MRTSKTAASGNAGDFGNGREGGNSGKLSSCSRRTDRAFDGDLSRLTADCIG